MPLRFQKRFRLERLRKDAAKRAIEGPVGNTSRVYAKNVAEGLVNNLLQQQIKYSDGTRSTVGEFVEPVQLLRARLPEDGHGHPDLPVPVRRGQPEETHLLGRA